MTMMPDLCGRFDVSPVICGLAMLLRPASLMVFHRALSLRRLNGMAGMVIYGALTVRQQNMCGTNKLVRPSAADIQFAGPLSGDRANGAFPASFPNLARSTFLYMTAWHNEHNVRFELDRAWAALRPGGAIVVDDINANWGSNPLCRPLPVTSR